MNNNIILVAYLLSSILFIIAIKKLGKVNTARQGNFLSAFAMLIAIIATSIKLEFYNPKFIIVGLIIGTIIGLISAKKVAMTSMPELVAIFNGLGGGASGLVAIAALFLPDTQSVIADASIVLTIIIGTITFSGSFVAYGKLKGYISSQPITYKGQNILNGLVLFSIIIISYFAIINPENINFFYIIIISGLLLGILSVIPIGGADMPVVISLLNSYSGIAAATAGFVLENHVLIVSGALVGASGIFLTNIMCKGMNRTLGNVLFSAFGSNENSAINESISGTNIAIKEMSADNAAYTMQASDSVIIVPGYGMAVAQAQHEVRKLSDELEKKGVTVKFAVHPVAGRMPGHMNVLLAEANIPYDKLFDMDEINSDFQNADIALIIGANDVVNPAAKHNNSSPIYGMPVLDVEKAKTTFVLKRSMKPGFAGIENELFGYDNNYMIFGDAKDSISQFVETLKEE